MLLAGSALGAWLLSRAWPLPWPGLDDVPARVVGIGFGLAGLALLAWAGAALRRRTTILPHKGAVRLVTDGPFRYRRNIYLADVLLLLGAAELTKNVWFVILAPLFAALVTWLAVLPEAAPGGEIRRGLPRVQGQHRRWI